MKKSSSRPAKAFFDQLLVDPEVKILYEAALIRSKVAHAIKAARTRAGLTQVALAKKAQTTQAVISRIESGTDSRTPTFELLSRIASACQASISFVIEFDSKKKAA